MVEVNEETLEVNDVVAEAENVIKPEIVEETMKDKIKSFGKKYKKPLIIAGTVLAGIGAIALKAMFFPSEVVDNLVDDDADDIESVAEVE